MNVWLAGAAVLLVSLVPLGVVCLRSPLPDAVVALQTGGAVATVALLLLAVGADRSPYADVAVLMALLNFGGGMAFARFLGRDRTIPGPGRLTVRSILVDVLVVVGVGLVVMGVLGVLLIRFTAATWATTWPG